jgi:hypothetical protein
MRRKERGREQYGRKGEKYIELREGERERRIYA